MTGIAEPIVTLNEAQAYVRIETGEEEALLAGLIRTASALCEAFINQVVIARPFEQDLPASGAWERLQVTPVRSITDVASLDGSGVETPLTETDSRRTSTSPAMAGCVWRVRSPMHGSGSAAPPESPIARMACRSLSARASCALSLICSRHATARAANPRQR